MSFRLLLTMTLCLVYLLASHMTRYHGVDKSRVTGWITYKPGGIVTEYVVVEYNDDNDRTKEKLYDQKGYLVGYYEYEYSDSRELTSLKWFGPLGNRLEETSYHHKDGEIRFISYKTRHNKEQYYINRVKTYDTDKKKVLTITDTHSYQKQFIGLLDFKRVSIVYTHTQDKKIIRSYSQDLVRGTKAKLSYTKIIHYANIDMIWSILVLDGKHFPIRYLTYQYTKDKKIRSIQSYRVIATRPWKRYSADLDLQNMKIHKHIVFHYSMEPFAKLKN